jgi:hypothetical protein
LGLFVSGSKGNRTDGKDGARMISEPICTGDDTEFLSAAACADAESYSYPCSGFAIHARP